jgi:hypothetical protein
VPSGREQGYGLGPLVGIGIRRKHMGPEMTGAMIYMCIPTLARHGHTSGHAYVDGQWRAPIGSGYAASSPLLSLVPCTA